ncbi:hypothetical protein LTR64_001948 [Lithohypha guttulata]|uniref:uncharacterized protein n=1 Tax=Lithohypha guttulata TaxID=1690604 RepID=UPI002DDF5A23|nr:hypothetical protein LTR51_007807 [Lithohypha guttulata]
MDSRLKNYISNRRARSRDIGSELDYSNVSHQAVSPSRRPPTFLYPVLGKNGFSPHKQSRIDVVALQSYSYEDCPAGKAPTFGTTPQRGNGPVKLQASRRMSSGDLIATAHDSQKTMQDLLGGHYVVDSANTTNGLGLFPPIYATEVRQDSSSDYRARSTYSARSHDSLRSTHRTLQETNATLKALRKAEFSKLVELYGSDAAAARNIAQIDSARLRGASSPTGLAPRIYSPVVLEPLPLPPIEGTEDDSKRISHSSADCSYDEWSDASSPHRASFVSSCGESSTGTTQTSLEDEPMATREDIRNMVEQMRSSYLTAIDSHTKSALKPVTKSKPRKKVRKTKLLPAPMVDHKEQYQSPPATFGGHQTWHSLSVQQDATYKRRVNSHPVNRTGRLSPIQASPSRDDKVDTGLKRADSSTLGGLLSDLARDKIASRRGTRSTSNRHDSRPTTPQNQVQESKDSWTYECSSTERRLLPLSATSNNHLHFEVDFNTSRQVDLEERPSGLDAIFSDELWTSARPVPSLPDSKTYPMHASLATGERGLSDAHIYNTPPRGDTLRVRSVPDSPEYRRLATNASPASNFI